MGRYNDRGYTFLVVLLCIVHGFHLTELYQQGGTLHYFF